MNFRLSLLIYILVCLVLLPVFQHDIAPDASSYISIARHYASFQFPEAVNGYWSPLISWLLVPFMWYGLDPVLSFKLILILFGFLSYREFLLILYHEKIKAELWIKRMIEFSILPLLCYFSIGSLSPDILSLFFLLKYLGIVLFPENKKHVALKTGIICALAYFAKNYNLVFLLAHFIIYSVYIKRIGRSAAFGFVTTLIVLFVCIGAWMIILGFKYNEITFSTAAAYNFAITGPEANWHPYLNEGLLAPPNSYAISAWEDPAYIPVKKWSPFDSADHFIFFLENVCRQTVRLLKYYLSYLPLLFSLLFLCFRFIFRRRETDHTEKLLVSFLLYPLPYLLIFVEERYVWIIHLILLLYSGYLFNRLFKIHFFYTFRVPLIMVFIGCISYAPLKMLYYGFRYSQSQKQVAADLASKSYLKQSRIASGNGLWNNGLYVSYYLDATYEGSMKKGITDHLQIEAELRKFNINYYIATKNGYYPDRKVDSVNTFQGKLFFYQVE